jgi:hypothetical protein
MNLGPEGKEILSKERLKILFAWRMTFIKVGLFWEG